MNISPEVPSPGLGINWGQLVTVAVANWLIFGAILVAVFDKQFMAAWSRCEESIMTRIDKHYADRIKVVDGIINQVGVHDDRLDKVDAAQTAQGRELREQMTTGFSRSERSFEQMTTTLVAIQKEANETAVAVGRLEERVAGNWQGPNRRERQRRVKGDAE